jgi:hypothetical protein
VGVREWTAAATSVVKLLNTKDAVCAKLFGCKVDATQISDRNFCADKAQVAIMEQPTSMSR